MDPIKPSQDVVPLSSFRANVSELLKQAQKTGRPIVITQHGRGAAVLISTEGYEELLDRLDLAGSISRGRADLAAGRTFPLDQVMGELNEIVADAKRGRGKARRKGAA